MLGNDGFVTACQNFLAKFRFSNAYSTDLFEYFMGQWPADGSGGIDRMEFYNVLVTWSTQRGFPLITAKEGDRTASSRVWQLSQQQYLLTDNDDNVRWPVWVQYSYKTAANVEVVNATWLLASNDYAAVVETPLDAQYVKFNYNRTAFYRVLYSSSSAYDDFRTALTRNTTTLTMQDRISLIADTYQMQRDGLLKSWSTLLNSTLPILAREASFPVWATGAYVVEDMWSRIRLAARNGTDDGEVVKSYVQKLVGYAASSVQWAVDNDHLNGLKQGRLGPLTCRFQLSPCLDSARTYYQYWLGNGSTATIIPANLRSVSIGYGARQRQDAVLLFTSYYLNAAASPTPQLATLYLEAAMQAAHPADILTMLQYFTNTTNPTLRFTDTVPSVMARLNQLNDQAQPTLVAALVQNPSLFHQLVLPFDAAGRSRAQFNSLIDVLVGAIQTQGDLDDIRNKVFTSDNFKALSGAGQTKVNAAYAVADANIEWVGANWPAMKAAMQSALATVLM